MDEKETAAPSSSGPPPLTHEEVKDTHTPKVAPKRSITEQANASIAAAKTGFDPLRPFRYAAAFTAGTLGDGLNGISKWGATGLKYGAAVGILVGIGAPWLFGIVGLMAVITGATAGALGGFGLGVLGGGTYGLATGGSRAVARMHRAEKYAEDLIVREKQQRTARPNRADYRRRAAAEREERDFEQQRQFMERQAEIDRDAKTYGTSWVDRVSSSNSNQGLGL